MGGFDLFHAASSPGNGFVWLHSLAAFNGGLWFGLIWLSPRFSPRKLPWFVLAASLAVAVISCLLPQWVPPMLDEDGEFTTAAHLLHQAGGLGFLLATSYLLRCFWQQGNREDWLFATQTSLFGMAGLVFAWSSLWEPGWWWWHVLRLGAYTGALGFAVREYLADGQAIRSINRQLRDRAVTLGQTIEQRTAALRESEERYALAVRGSTDGLWDWNVLTNEVYYSPRFKELLEYSDPELENVFSTFESRLHPDDRERTLGAIDRHLTRRVPYDVEYQLRIKDGTYRWFRARGQAVWNEAGRPTRMAGSITDISERKQAESGLEHERFLLHTLLDHLPDAIYFKDTNGRYLRASRALAEQHGVESAGQLKDRSAADFLPPEEAEAVGVEERQLMDAGRPMIGKEERLRHASGRVVWVSTTKVPLRDEQGHIIGTFGISHDITSQKQAEERLRCVIEAAAEPARHCRCAGHDPPCECGDRTAVRIPPSGADRPADRDPSSRETPCGARGPCCSVLRASGSAPDG